MKLTILGSGTSNGVPQIGCHCSTCSSKDPRDNRLRCSALIESEEAQILIDCGPDFRQQFMRHPMTRLNAIFITHEHYDHVGGLDDLRPMSLFGELKVYAEDICARHLMERIPYCFTPKEKRYQGVPSISLEHMEIHVPIKIHDVELLPIRVMHGKLPIAGFRIGGLTYITDMKYLPEEEWKYLEGTVLLVVNALHHKPHPSHQTVKDAIEFAKKVEAKQTYFIHMSHYVLPHSFEEARLPEGIHFAFDGLELEF